ncbi:JmjC domain-containing protein [Amphibiibacter pelophylacis]|uniref:Cupin domain-containing protein n=1 Tax=Amphibiibacter pelophylacis TaxID=1799477 RepID=A0ACC6P3U4_9BURK
MTNPSVSERQDRDLGQPTPLLGGLSPAVFMRDHWQKKPLLVRGAWPEVQPPLDAAQLRRWCQQEGVESRLIQRSGPGDEAGWTLKHGPLKRRDWPGDGATRWTVLMQGVDTHLDAARALLDRFDFIPAARLDDLMISLAADGGGVGPHVDAYDVFLLQVSGQRRWRIGPVADARIRPGLPLRILADFTPTVDEVLNPGDMLYLPPHYGHDGIAVGDGCMTCSVGFRSPRGLGLASQVLQRLLDDLDLDSVAFDDTENPIYTDPDQAATAQGARIPPQMLAFMRQHLARLLDEGDALGEALGSLLSEPKPDTVFDAPGKVSPTNGGGVRLARATRMLYGEGGALFINGESFEASGPDLLLLQRLADTRQLAAQDVQRLTPDARAILQDWLDDGWLHGT